MTDNARIVKDERIDALREALAYLKEQSWKYDDYRSFEAESEAWGRVDSALAALGTDLATAKTGEEETMIVLKRIAAIAEEHGWENDGAVLLSSFLRDLATAKEDLERARVEVAEALGTLKYSEKHGSPQHSHCIPGRWNSNGRECADCKAWEKVRSFASNRAALAPEQKGGKP